MKKQWWLDESVMGSAMAPKLANIQTTFDVKNQRGLAPAGLVAEGEYVIGKDAVDKIGAPNLDKLQEKVLGRPMVQGGAPINGLPSYGCKGKDDGGLVTKGKMMKSYGTISLGSVKNIKPDSNNQTSGIANPNGVDAGNPAFSGTTTSGYKPTYSVSGLTTPATPGIAAVNGQRPNYAASGFTFNSSGLAPVAAPPSASAPAVAATGTGYVPPAPATVVNQIPTQPPKSTEELARLRGLQGIGQIASGQHPLFRTLANQAQQQIATQGAMDEASLRQQMAQMGVTGGAANAMMADLNRDIGSNLATSAATTATNAQKLSADAMGELAKQGIAGMQMERANAETDFNVQMKQYQDLMDSGQFDKAKEMYASLKGDPRFSNWVGVEPDWGIVAKNYNSATLKASDSQIAKDITAGVPEWILSSSIRENLIARGVDPAKITDATIHDEYERLTKTNTTVEADLKNKMAATFKILPEEQEAFDNWFGNALYNNTLVEDANGNLRLSETGESPLTDPRYAHMFDDRYTTNRDALTANYKALHGGQEPSASWLDSRIVFNQTVKDSRSAYVASNPDNLTSYTDWRNTVDSAFETGYAAGKTPAEMADAAINGVNALVPASKYTDVATGQTYTLATAPSFTVGSTPVFKDNNGTRLFFKDGTTVKPYTYTEWKAAIGTKTPTTTDVDALRSLVETGDSGAATRIGTLYASNPSILTAQDTPGTAVYDAVLATIPGGVPADGDVGKTWRVGSSGNEIGKYVARVAGYRVFDTRDGKRYVYDDTGKWVDVTGNVDWQDDGYFLNR